MPLPVSSQLLSRQARVRQHLEASNLDAFVVTSATNIRYLSNHVGSSGTLVLTRDRAYLLIDSRYREAVSMRQRTDSACPELLIRDVPDSYDGALFGCLREIGATAVGFEAAHVSVATHASWRRTAERDGFSCEFHVTDRVVEAVRLIKDSTEVASLRDAAARLTPVAAAAFEAVRAGERERTVAAAIEAALRGAGFERPAFDTIVASGPHAALPHHRAGDRVLIGGDLVVLDFGGVLDGYCSDLSRTVSIGSASPEARRLYDAVYDAQHAAMQAVCAGTVSTSVDAAARGVLRGRGFGDVFGHGTGHGIGLDVHEEPRITWPRPDVPAVCLEAGMVFTVEPGAYVPGFGGVRIEDDVLVTATGCEVLTQVSRELLLL